MTLFSLKKLLVKKNKGFTFIELVVTISIMLVIVGGGIASFIRFNDRQNVQVAANDLQTMLRSAQIKAKTGEGASSCATTNTYLIGYRVYALSNANQATLYQICAANKFVTNANSNQIKKNTINFDSSVKITSGVDVTFISLLGGIKGGGTVTISGSGNNVYSFDIGSGGEITEGSFQ